MSGPEIVIRRLGSVELGSFREMLTMFGEAFADRQSYCARQPSEAYLTELLRGDNVVAIAAFDRETVVGGLFAYVLRKFEQERSEVYIYDLAVAASYRRHGIATRMITCLESEARELGAYVIYVQADRDDEAAIQLYSKLGRREDVLHFDIQVRKK